VLIVLFFLIPETSAATILYCRAKRLRKHTGKATLKSQPEIDAAEVPVKDHLVMLCRAFTMTFSEPVSFFVDLYRALLYGVLYIWFESFPPGIRRYIRIQHRRARASFPGYICRRPYHTSLLPVLGSQPFDASIATGSF